MAETYEKTGNGNLKIIPDTSFTKEEIAIRLASANLQFQMTLRQLEGKQKQIDLWQSRLDACEDLNIVSNAEPTP
jgi:hypothetical protein